MGLGYMLVALSLETSVDYSENFVPNLHIENRSTLEEMALRSEKHIYCDLNPGTDPTSLSYAGAYFGNWVKKDRKTARLMINKTVLVAYSTLKPEQKLLFIDESNNETLDWVCHDTDYTSMDDCQRPNKDQRGLFLVLYGSSKEDCVVK
tara:strand:- start:819 stop:1265 length:447 start_codon:yes stop_codon:yes gene_type:complete